MTTLINLREMIALHDAVKASGNEDHAEILSQLYQTECQFFDVEDVFQAAEELVEAAGRNRDKADAALMNRHQDDEANRADDKYDERVEDGI